MKNKPLHWQLTIVLVALLGVSSSAMAVVLCHTCKINEIDTENSSSQIRFKSTPGIGTGPCVGTMISTNSSLNEQQKQQIMSGLLSAMVTGTHITANGDSSSCSSFDVLTIKKP